MPVVTRLDEGGLPARSGVILTRRQVTGWPRLDLKVLEDPANLLRFVAVLDRIVADSQLA